MYAEIGTKDGMMRSDVEKRFHKRVQQILKASGQMRFYRDITRKSKDTLDASYMGEYACIADHLKEHREQIHALLLTNEKAQEDIDKIIKDFNLKISKIDIQQIIDTAPIDIRERLKDVIDGFSEDVIAYEDVISGIKGISVTLVEVSSSREFLNRTISDLRDAMSYVAIVKMGMQAKLDTLMEILSEIGDKDRRKEWERIYSRLVSASTQSEVIALENGIQQMWAPEVITVKGVLIKVLDEFLEGKISDKDAFFTALKEELANSSAIKAEFKELSREQIENIIDRLKGKESLNYLYRILQMVSYEKLSGKSGENTKTTTGKKRELLSRIREAAKANSEKITIILAGLAGLLMNNYFGIGGEHSLSIVPFILAAGASNDMFAKEKEELANPTPSWLEEVEFDKLLKWWIKNKNTVYIRPYFHNALSEMNNVLSKHNGRSGVVFLGKASTGKSLLLNWISYNLLSGETPHKNIKIYKLNTSEVLENNPSDVVRKIKEVIARDRKEGFTPVIIADEIHRLSRTEPSILEAMKEILESQDEDSRVVIIGATTSKEWDTYIADRDEALSSRFAKVQMPQLTTEELTRILLQMKRQLEQAHGVEIDSVAISYLARKALQLFPNAPEPREALDLLLTAVNEKINQRKETELKSAIARLYSAIGSYKSANTIQEKAMAKSEIETATKQVSRLYNAMLDKTIPRITRDDIDRTFERRGIPRIAFIEDKGEINQWVDGLNTYLKQEIIGQDEVIDEITEKIRISLLNPDRKGAVGVFMLGGPTGTGKTELAEAIARYISADKNIPAIVKESGEQIKNIKKLFGAEASYVGYGDETFISRANDEMQKNPMVVMLIDEVEKSPVAKELIQGFVMQMEKPGAITDGKRRVLNNRNVILIYTTNEAPEGYWPYDKSKEEVRAVYEQAITDMFRQISGDDFVEHRGVTKSPELARFTAVEVMPPLTPEEVRRVILEKYLPRISEMFKENNIIVDIKNKNEIAQRLEEIYKKAPQRGFRGVLEAVEEIRAALVQAIDKEDGYRRVTVLLNRTSSGWDVSLVGESPIDEREEPELEGEIGAIVRAILDEGVDISKEEFAVLLQSLKLPQKQMPDGDEVAIDKLIEDSYGRFRDLLAYIKTVLSGITYDSESALNRMPLSLNLLKQKDGAESIKTLSRDIDEASRPINSVLSKGRLYIKTETFIPGEWIVLLNRIKNKKPIDIYDGNLSTSIGTAIEVFRTYALLNDFDWGVDEEGNLVLEFDVERILKEEKSKNNRETDEKNVSVEENNKDPWSSYVDSLKEGRMSPESKDNALQRSSSPIDGQDIIRRVSKLMETVDVEGRGELLAVLSVIPEEDRKEKWDALMSQLVAETVPVKEGKIPYKLQIQAYWEYLYRVAHREEAGMINRALLILSKNKHLLDDGVRYAPEYVMGFLGRVWKMMHDRSEKDLSMRIDSSSFKDIKEYIENLLLDKALNSPDELVRRQLYLNAIEKYKPGIWDDDMIRTLAENFSSLVNGMMNYFVLDNSSIVETSKGAKGIFVFFLICSFLGNLVRWDLDMRLHMLMLSFLFTEMSITTYLVKRRVNFYPFYKLLSFPWVLGKEKDEIYAALYELSFYVPMEKRHVDTLSKKVLQSTARSGRYAGSDIGFLFTALLNAYKAISDDEVLAVTKVLMERTNYFIEDEDKADLNYTLMKLLNIAQHNVNRNEAISFRISNALAGIARRVLSASQKNIEGIFFYNLLNLWLSDNVNIPTDEQMHNRWANELLSELEGRGANIGDLEGVDVEKLKENPLAGSVLGFKFDNLKYEYPQLKDLYEYAGDKLNEYETSDKLKLWSFSTPVYKDGKILIAKSRKGEIFMSKPIVHNPIAQFHEAIEWLGEEGLITAEVEGNRVVIRDDKGNVLANVEFEPEEMNDKWIDEAKAGNVHYALRIVQRTIFGKEDVQLSGQVRLWKLVFWLMAEGEKKEDIIAVFRKMGVSTITSVIGSAEGEVDTKSDNFKALWEHIIEQVNKDDELKAYLQYLSGGELYLGELADSPYELSWVLEDAIEGAQEGDGEIIDEDAISAALAQTSKASTSSDKPEKAGGILLFTL